MSNHVFSHLESQYNGFIAFSIRDELQKAINAESDARSYLREELSRQYSEKCFISAEANWKYATNITKENEKNKVISR